MVVTTFDTDEYAHQALAAGARGFLLKDASPDQLVRAVNAGGQGRRDPRRRGHGPTARHLRPPWDHRPRAASRPVTERKEGVLLTVARGRTNAEVGRDLYISMSTVKFHLANRMTKVGVRNRVELGIWVRDWPPEIAQPAGSAKPGAGHR